MRAHRLVLAASPLAMIMALTACVSADNDPPAATEGFAEHMHGHLEQISAVKAAVIAGDLEAAREPATWLAEHQEPPGMPDAWAPYVNDMRMQASVAASAENIETVAVAVSEIARSCGSCHAATGFAVAFGYDQRPPAEEQNLMTQMQRHLWAADRMWEGLIGPSDIAWEWGTEMLAEVQLAGSQITDAPDKKARVDELVEQIRDVGSTGSTAPAGPSRSAMYGQFLSLCANCHSLTGGGPGTT